MLEILTLEGVGKDYGAGPARVEALKAVDLSLATGEVVVVLGPSGSGKSTMLQLAAGLDKPTRGQVSFRNQRLDEMDEEELTALRRRDIGFVFQFFNLVPAMTALQNVALPLRFDGVAAEPAETRAGELLDLVGLTQRRDHVASGLSGGEMQRVALARALVGRPAILFADEPTGSLDSRNGASILKLLGELPREQDVSVLLVTHDPRAVAHADRVALMEDGAIAHIGDPDSLDAASRRLFV